MAANPYAFSEVCGIYPITPSSGMGELVDEWASKERRNLFDEVVEVAEVEIETDPMPLLEQAFDMAVQEDGWARLDRMGSNLYQLDPGFDPRTYGHKQLSRLVGNLKGVFEMRTQEIDGSTLLYVKMKE